MTDGLSTLYQDLLGGSYDCVDRIVLNAYFHMGHHPGGFRVWWRALTGSDETLEGDSPLGTREIGPMPVSSASVRGPKVQIHSLSTSDSVANLTSSPTPSENLIHL
jgi:hypothetical protein